MNRKYRILRDIYSGFEVQYKVWWWPFWIQCGKNGGSGVNTNSSLEIAEQFAKMHSGGKVVKYLGEL